MLTEIQRMRYTRREATRAPTEPQWVVDKAMLNILALLGFGPGC